MEIAPSKLLLSFATVVNVIKVILQLFVFALFFIIFGGIAIRKKKAFLGWTFVLLGTFTAAIGLVVVLLYPQTLPF